MQTHPIHKAPAPARESLDLRIGCLSRRRLCFLLDLLPDMVVLRELVVAGRGHQLLGIQIDDHHNRASVAYLFTVSVRGLAACFPLCRTRARRPCWTCIPSSRHPSRPSTGGRWTPSRSTCKRVASCPWRPWSWPQHSSPRCKHLSAVSEPYPLQRKELWHPIAGTESRTFSYSRSMTTPAPRAKWHRCGTANHTWPVPALSVLPATGPSCRFKLFT